jgi:hypothetical protein
MIEKIPLVFIEDVSRLPLLNDYGREFVGLENSSSPELVGRVKALFEYLNEHLGFPNSIKGQENQNNFNLMLRSIYPEIMIDLADLIYTQHERLAVFLSFDQININLDKSLDRNRSDLQKINQKMTQLFHDLATTIAESSNLKQDPIIIRLLSESYSYYLYQTKNFPWEDLPQPRLSNLQQPVLDVATGLSGFSRIYSWSENFPKLVLSDSEPFIVSGLSHYLELTGRKNVVLVDADFPSKPPDGMKFGLIIVNKFLHHLKRAERVSFLNWSRSVLETKGVLEILDTDLEHHIIDQSLQPEFKNKLTVGYLKTLVEIESDYTDTLKFDVEDAGFRIINFDCKEYFDETDVFSQNPGDMISLKFKGLEIIAEKII